MDAAGSWSSAAWAPCTGHHRLGAVPVWPRATCKTCCAGQRPPADVPMLALLSPDRWLLWLGVLFVLSVYYFPTGVVGKLRASARP